MSLQASIVVAAVVERRGGANDTRLQDESPMVHHQLQRRPIHFCLIFDNSWAGARAGGSVKEARYCTAEY
jgi:hypothetical protein